MTSRSGAAPNLVVYRRPFLPATVESGSSPRGSRGDASVAASLLSAFESKAGGCPAELGLDESEDLLQLRKSLCCGRHQGVAACNRRDLGHPTRRLIMIEQPLKSSSAALYRTPRESPYARGNGVWHLILKVTDATRLTQSVTSLRSWRPAGYSCCRN